jgi:hypothetical protein
LKNLAVLQRFTQAAEVARLEAQVSFRAVLKPDRESKR